MSHPDNLPCPDEKYFVPYIDFRELNNRKNLITGYEVLKRSIYSKESQKKIENLLDEVDIDVAHIQNIHGHITPSIFAILKKKNIPVVWTLHDYKLLCPNTHFLSDGVICEKCKGKRFFNATIHKCKKNSYSASLVASIEAYTHSFMKITDYVDKFISPSEFLKNKFIEFGFTEDKIIVNNNFLSTEAFSYLKNEGTGYVLYLGQIEKWKGIETLVKTASLLKNIDFKLAGDGSLLNDLQNYVKENNINNIFFLGRKTGNDLQEIIKNSKVVVLPSEWYENFPFSIMETMAAGKPVICSNIGGLPELVTDKVDGFLFKSGNHKELAEKIEILFNDEQLYNSFSMNAYENAKKKYDAEHHYGKLFDLYNSLIPIGEG